MAAGDTLRARAQLLDELERLREDRVAGLRQADRAMRGIDEAVRRGVELGLTKAELSLAAGVSRPTINARVVSRAA